MTLANRITLGRIALVPVFLVLVAGHSEVRPGWRWAALAVFALAAISDGLDGWAARRLNQRTRLGAVLDPLADKLLLNLAFVFLAANPAFREDVPLWVPATILTRDAAVALGAYSLRRRCGPYETRPRLLGKLATTCQMIAVVVALCGLGIAYHWMILTVAVTLLSMLDYLAKGARRLREYKRTS